MAKVEYWRDDRPLLRYIDAAPYTQGWFALRTTQSHLRIERFRVYELPRTEELRAQGVADAPRRSTPCRSRLPSRLRRHPGAA